MSPKKTRGRPRKDKSESKNHDAKDTKEEIEHIEALSDILYPPLPPEYLEDNSDDKVRSPDQTFNECLIPSDDEDDNILNQLRNGINDSSLYPPDRELQLALEVSMKENSQYNDNLQELNEILILSKLEFEEHLKNKKDHRKSVLSNFYRKLQFLHFPHVIEQLNEYFQCNIETIYLDNTTYKSIFEIIDSYYKIPNEKGRKCAISEEEDSILRAIFILK